MKRMLWIPVSGTVAALIAILLAHGPREGAAAQPDPRSTRDDFPELPPLDDDVDEEKPDRPPPPTPEPESLEYHLVLNDDGSFTDADAGTSYDDAKVLVEQLAKDGPRHKVIVSNGTGVNEKDLDEALARLQGKFEKVRKDFRPPKDEDG